MAGGNINNLTMEQYLTLTRGNQAPCVVRPEIRGNVNFEIKRVTRDAIMLRVFLITLIGAAKSNNSEGMVAIVSKLDNLGRDIQKLKENVHAIQVGFQLCNGPHLDKECPLNEDAKSVEEVKYGEGRSSPFNGMKYRVGPPGYYTQVDNRPPFGDKRLSLEELMNNHLEELARRSSEIKEC
ncbi:hypothetical protein Tco_1063584 [Tanacetum coccineum]